MALFWLRSRFHFHFTDIILGGGGASSFSFFPFFTLLQAQPHGLSGLGWLVGHVGSLAEAGFCFGPGVAFVFEA